MRDIANGVCKSTTMSNLKKATQPAVKAVDLVHGDEAHEKMEVSASISVSTSKCFVLD